MPKLDNDMHEMFCNEYIKDLNLTQAYSRAYPASNLKAAASSASTLLRNPNVQSRISELMAARSKRVGVTADMVVKRLTDIAFGELGMICVWDDDGLTLKDVKELQPEERAIIDSIDISPIGDGDGGLLGYRKRVKLKDSTKALELLGKHLGIFDGVGSDSKGRNSDAIHTRLLDMVGRIKARGTKP